MKIAWWRAPLAIAAGGLATVTLSACYGPACVSTITKPDGTKVDGYSCAGDYDCTQPLADGGVKTNDSTWVMNCADTSDAGNTNDAGNTSDAGNGDAGNPDAGP